ncbi:C4-dicarboxylate transporter DctA [Roseiarcaceae bacterium H3SJ34-1]|uniref:C4-dicarboxylate transporter DctA n=1 Tax=Terripilifer ovatus TaxID=3032367 RepID=UPI003AB91D77|nr:C4-dicarboxylate transporter DctA [Roseiarcaceae bacterium H3SJ34-1]
MDAESIRETRASRPARPWYAQLWVQVLVATAVGVALGYWQPELGAKMEPLGDAFIKAIRVIIAPVIFCTVVHGIARMSDMARVGRVAVKALLYFEVMTTVALIIALVTVNLLKPGVGMNVDLTKIDTSTVDHYITQTQHTNIVGFLLNVIPNSFAGAFVEGQVLQVLYVAVLCGFALAWMGQRAQPVLDLIDAASQMFFGIVRIIMWAAPLGAFGAIAFTVGRFELGSLQSLGWLLGSFYFTCLVFIFCALGPIAYFCGFSLLKLLRYIWEEILIVLATTSSEVVLPRLIRKMEAAGCERSVVGLVVPTGYSFNLDGTCLYLAMTTVFLAQATNTQLDLSQQIGLLLILLLTSKGAAGVAGAAFVVLAATLASSSTIPVTSVALVLGIHRFMSEGLTPTNLIGNAVATIVVAKWENALDTKKLDEALAGGAPIDEI